MELFGVRFVGINAENANKLLFTLALFAVVMILRYLAGAIAQGVLRAHPNERVRFWTWQIISLISMAVITLGVLSIWFDKPESLTTAVGLVTAGLAFALQKVVTSFAAYFIILRGRNFTVGERIVLGGVRGEVIAIGFTQTTIMEMGQSPPEQPDAPATWVKSRQFTGRVASITNDKIFEQPVYNFTREYPYLWEELTVPVAYRDDRDRVEQILLEVAERHTLKLSEMSQEALERMRQRYTDLAAETKPRVYLRLTDNWVELTLRFVSEVEGTRKLKDAMSRDILKKLDEAGIGIASATFEIVGLPPLRIENGAQIKVEGKSSQAVR
jgi:small-conductance mechanosensitive channel